MDIDARLQTVAEELSAGMPGRVVTRSFRDPSEFDDADLLRGVVMIVATGAGDFSEVLQRALGEADITFAVVGYVLTDECNREAQGLAVERAELALFAEIQAAVRDSTVCALDISALNQSRQLESPHGWIVVNMTWREV